LDVHIIVDSIADIMSHEDKDLCKYGHLAITVLFETASLALRNQMEAARLPFFEYLAGKILIIGLHALIQKIETWT